MSIISTWIAILRIPGVLVPGELVVDPWLLPMLYIAQAIKNGTKVNEKSCSAKYWTGGKKLRSERGHFRTGRN